MQCAISVKVHANEAQKTKSAHYYTYRGINSIQVLFTQVVSLNNCDFFLVILVTPME